MTGSNVISPDQLTTVAIDGGDVTVARWGDGPTEIVLLHDGLGSISQWRSIPGMLAERTGAAVLAYDRPGHGRSTPVPAGPWPADWLHVEAERFARLLGELDVDRPLLVGHSDGGSIALLYAARLGTESWPTPIRAVVTLAAHSWVEQSCFDAIAGMRAGPAPIIEGLTRHHADPAAVFEAWSGVWVSDDFRPWDIRPMLSTIACPTVVAQGRGDEYASEAHASGTAAAIGANGQCLLLDDVGHLLHHQDPELVVDVVTRVFS